MSARATRVVGKGGRKARSVISGDGCGILGVAIPLLCSYCGEGLGAKPECDTRVVPTAGKIVLRVCAECECWDRTTSVL